jgi:cysteine desulfurase
MMKVYFDNAATTAIDNRVIESMNNVMKNNYANPSSIHEGGRKSKTIIENARKKIASILNTSPGSIFFTSGGTEADNMAIRCGILDNKITHAITSKISHHAVLYPLQDLEIKGNIKLSYVKLNEFGGIDINHLEDILKNNPKSFVSIMHANNEVGTIQPIKEIGELCKKYNAIFHSDTVQTMGHFKFDMKELNIDFLVASAHKFHGPKGIGFIYINENISIKPLILGGSQERNMRAGTENIYSIVGLVEALEISHKEMEADVIHVKKIKKYFIDLLEKNFDDIKYNGESNNMDSSLFKILSVSFPKNPISEMLLFQLDIMGISCSGGSACSSGSDQGSHVISGINSSNDRPVVRFSFSKYNTKEEIDYTIEKLIEIFN